MSPIRDLVADPARILIVDDERQNRQLLEVMLTPEGYGVHLAASGDEALAILAGPEPPDLILLDVMMPGMDGYEVAGRIKSDPATKNIPIIIVSALGDRFAKMLGLTAGAEEFLTKPVDRAELCVRVRNLLRLKAYGDYHDKHSHRLEAEVALRTADLAKSEARYRRMIETTSQGVWLIDAEMKTTFINGRMAQMLGCGVAEAVGLPMHELVDDEVSARLTQSLLHSKPELAVHAEVEVKRRDGTTFWALLERSAIVDPDGRVEGVLAMVIDVSERRNAEAARLALEAQLRQAQKMEAVGRLAGGLAHDFNNVLSVILSYGDLLLDDLEAGNPMRDDVEEIRKAGSRAAGLTRQLLMFSRQHVLEPKVVDLNELLSSMNRMLPRILGEDVEIISRWQAELGRVKADPSSLEQVIMNLAVNARDAMPTGGTLTITTANVDLGEDFVRQHVGMNAGRHVMVAVSDTGVGMDATTQTRIFEPFFTTKPKEKGTGLGLSTVFGIAQQSGGCVCVESGPGKGTTFTVYLPRVDASVETPAATTQPATLRGAETILLVEDDEQVRQVASGILRRCGYHVIVCRDAGEALLHCGHSVGEIELLLTDVVMPQMSGPELAKRLATARPAMKVLCMSGYTDDSIVRHGVLEAELAYLQKPITPESLSTKVREVLDAAPNRGVMTPTSG